LSGRITVLVQDAAMPRNPSPAQADASRRNGRRSSGPATPEGKARSAQNARSFGLRSAELVLLDGEDAARFALLQAAIHDRFQPGCPLEAALCARMARALWRAERAQRLEASFWSVYPDDLPSDDAHPLQAILEDDRRGRHPALPTILRYLAEADRAFARALRDLEQLRRNLADPLDEAGFIPSDAPCTDEPEPAPEPANDDRVPADLAAVPDATNEPEPVPEPPPALPPPDADDLPTARDADAERTNEPEPPPATPADRALHELAHLRRFIAGRWPLAMLHQAEAFVLQFGADGKGPPAWVRDLPEGTRLAWPASAA
jgi:hypothetical protein